VGHEQSRRAAQPLPLRSAAGQGRAEYHQLPHDWLLRNGTTYPEDRELGTRRARAAALMELGLPGAAYIYQGEELGLFEVADIPWDRLEDPTAFHTASQHDGQGP
jgi:alpha-glucosidase